MRLRVLITGFAPFGGSKVNPSWEAVKRLRRARIGGVRVSIRRLPVLWDTARVRLVTAIRRSRPDVVICVGQSSGRNGVCLEERAVNRRSGKDARGRKTPTPHILSTAPKSYGATLPTDQILLALRSAGIPARRSKDAGRYLCNEVMFAALHEATDSRPFGDSFLAGFIHVPMLPSQAKGRFRREPTLPLGAIVKALRIVLRTTVERNILRFLR